jgi:hypothetical protein
MVEGSVRAFCLSPIFPTALALSLSKGIRRQITCAFDPRGIEAQVISRKVADKRRKIVAPRRQDAKSPSYPAERRSRFF